MRNALIKFFLCFLLIVLLSSCSDMPASAPSARGAPTPMPTMSSASSPEPTLSPTPLPSPSATATPPAQPLITAPPYADFDGSLPYWQMLTEFGPTLGMTSASVNSCEPMDDWVEHMPSTYSGEEFAELLLRIGTWNALPVAEQSWIKTREYEIRIDSRQSFEVNGESRDVLSVLIVDTDDNTVIRDMLLEHWLYFVDEPDGWKNYSSLFLRNTDGSLDEGRQTQHATRFVQDRQKRGLWLELRTENERKDASWTRVELFGLTQGSIKIDYIAEAEAISMDGWRVTTQAALDSETTPHDFTNLIIRQNAESPKGAPQCGLTHTLGYEWSYDNLVYTGHRARFDDGYEVDYGKTLKENVAYSDYGMSRLFSYDRYRLAQEPVYVNDLPERAQGPYKYPWSFYGFEPYTWYIEENPISLNDCPLISPELTIDYIAECYGAHRMGATIAYIDAHNYAEEITTETFELSLKGTLYQAIWIESPNHSNVDYERSLFVKYPEGWRRIYIASVPPEYRYMEPYVVQSPDGQTAWVVNGINDGYNGASQEWWFNLVTRRNDFEYATYYPGSDLHETYSFEAKADFDGKNANSVLKRLNGPVVIKGTLRDYNDNHDKAIYTCAYETIFAYDTPTRSLMMSSRKIKSSKGFVHEEHFPPPSDTIPDIALPDIETRPLTDAEVAVVSARPHGKDFHKDFSPLEYDPAQVEELFSQESDYALKDVVDWLTDLPNEQMFRQFANEIEMLAQRERESDTQWRAVLKAYDERAFLHDVPAQLRVCEFVFMQFASDSTDIANAFPIDSLRLYFINIDGKWKLTQKIRIYTWHDETSEVKIVGQEDSLCLWLMHYPPPDTGTGYWGHKVVLRNLLTGAVDFSYTSDAIDRMLPEMASDTFTILYGLYEKLMPDGKPMPVLAKTVYVRTGILKYAWTEGAKLGGPYEPREILYDDREGDGAFLLVAQIHHTSEFRFSANKRQEMTLVSYVLDAPLTFKDNVAMR